MTLTFIILASTTTLERVSGVLGKKINLSLLDDYSKDKLVEQLSYMYWDHGKFKDQQPKVRSEHADDYSDSIALACFGQQKVEFMREVPDLWGVDSVGHYEGW